EWQQALQHRKRALAGPTEEEQEDHDERVAKDRVRLTPAEREKMIDHPGDGTNALLTQTGDQRFSDVAKSKGIGVTGWSWNSKFADLNNDEWQDLYVVNGEFVTGSRESNQFYENQGGEKFVEKTKEYGLRSFLAASAYTYLDMDNDGDLDIIAVPVIGPIYTYRNNLGDGNAIAFKLRDHAGNRFGIGSKITIHYGDGAQRHQMRELQASGGFISFDAAIAHFGLSTHNSVERVEVSWSTGGKTVMQGPFAAGATYLIERNTK
ncbi:MAG TPA: CRTAC1 family protein, partial [Planctomycetes bacterium]|nr:CRTAC1 family protein [Planctomycetota bacterium]